MKKETIFDVANNKSHITDFSHFWHSSKNLSHKQNGYMTHQVHAVKCETSPELNGYMAHQVHAVKRETSPEFQSRNHTRFFLNDIVHHYVSFANL